MADKTTTFAITAPTKQFVLSRGNSITLKIRVQTGNDPIPSTAIIKSANITFEHARCFAATSDGPSLTIGNFGIANIEGAEYWIGNHIPMTLINSGNEFKNIGTADVDFTFTYNTVKDVFGTFSTYEDCNTIYISVVYEEGSPPTESHDLYWYDNGVWKECDVFYYDGTKWQECEVYSYDGTKWQSCATS